MRVNIRRLILSVIAAFLTGCLAEEALKNHALSLTNSWFEGVKRAQNLGGSPASVRISWDPPLQTVSAYRIYAVQQSMAGSAWELLDEVSASTTSYVHSGLISGNLYTYRVRALDVTGTEETNNRTAGTIAFEGILDAIVLSSTSVQVRINSPYGSFDEVRVYAEPKFGGTKSLVGRIQGSATSFDVTGLRSGTPYRFSVQAYAGFLGNEDGNNVYIERTMPSEGFGSGSVSEGMDKYAYRGFLSVQAYGNAPNAPMDDIHPGRNPRTRLNRLTWLPFANASGNTKYRLFRVSAGRSFDTNITGACNATTETTCVVCTVQGAGAQTCEDTNLPTFDPLTTKKKFMYMVSLVKKDSVTGQDYVEALPPENSEAFQVAVPLPPDYMSLVHRDAVNYEICQIMNRTSDPKKNQRCPFNGLGAAPKNSGPGKADLNLSSSYYDFGYNLFADRYALSCNWTRASEGGKCGPGGSDGDCIGFGPNINPASDPAMADLGVVGNVYQYVIDGSFYCLRKTASGWRRFEGGSNAGTFTREELAGMLTEVPAADGLSAYTSNTTSTNAPEVCGAKDTAYGNKRVPRRREVIAAMSFPWMSGEPFAMTTYDARTRTQNGSDGIGPGFRQCSPNASNTSPGAIFQIPVATNFAEALSVFFTTAFKRLIFQISGTNYGNSEPVAGSPYFVSCVSRFGLQIRPDGIATSDAMIRQDNLGGNFDYLGITSPVDSGNTDLAGFRFNGQRGWSTNAEAVSASITTGANAAASGGVAFTYWNVPLGLPVVGKSSSLEDLTPLADFLAVGVNYGHSVNSHYVGSNSSVGSISYLGSMYRWGLRWLNPGNWIRARCVQEAE